MDSLSQLVLGAAVAALAAPRRHRRVALAAGAALGTLPDLDVIPLSLLDLDAVENMTWHRGASHSLLLLPIGGWLLWLALKRWWCAVREAPRSWFIAIQLALLTHPLLDAVTIYGTQLWWPLPMHPVMGGSLFIIDPLYTLPLLVGCVAALIAPTRIGAHRVLVAGMILSTVYVGWSMAAQAWVDRLAGRELARIGWADAPRFVTPSPLNTILWRVVVMTPDFYLEGYHSLIADEKPIEFRAYESDTAALDALADAPSVRRLRWFNRGFMKAETRAGQLVLSDLRMGSEPDYVFRFAVAEVDSAGGWRVIEHVPEVEWPASKGRAAGVWTRMWNEP